MIDLDKTPISSSPYPGLRSFDRQESDIFFGREEQTDQLLEKLQHARFLAVVGPSGCGKSSLVRAGLMSALETGFLADAGANWRIAEMRPGEQPLLRLAKALLSASVLGAEHVNDPEVAAFLLANLRCGPLGLIQVLRETPLPENVNLLLLVDQFEEIFRFRDQGNADQADAFVALLLETIKHREFPVYIIITMRSDFLGESALFRGLPEEINDSQYLTPRLTREQCRSAITGPARVFGGDVEPTLVNRLLNEMGTDPDQLPLLQHLMMRLWTQVSVEAEINSNQGNLTGVGPRLSFRAITLDDYNKVGTLVKALSIHADEVLTNLSESQQRIAEVLFRRLTERSLGQRDIRRPARLIEVTEVSEASIEEVMEVVDEFRRTERSFITPPPPTPLAPETILDIGHESLIRQWKRLNEWVDEEARSADIYRRLKQTARLWKSEEADLWGGIDLDKALAWKKAQNPTSVWASRYGTNEGFEVAMEFLSVSERHWQERLQKKRAEAKALAEAERRHVRLLRIGLLVLALLLVIMGSLTLFAFQQRKEANRQARIALSQQLATEAIYRSENDPPDKPMSLSVNAYKTYPTFEAQNALFSLMEKYSGLIAFLYGHEAVQSVAFSPDGKLLASGGNDGTVRLWDVSTSKQIDAPLNGHTSPVTSVAFSPDGRMLASGSYDETIRLWDVETLKPMGEPLRGHKKYVLTIAFSPDGKLLTSGGKDNIIRLWDVTRAAPPVEFARLENNIMSLTFSPDGKLLASGSNDNKIRLWDVKTRKQMGKDIIGHTSYINTLAFSPNGAMLVSGSLDSTIRFWDTKNYRPIDEPLNGHSKGVNSIAFSRDGKLLASGGDDNTVLLWDVATRKKLGRPLIGHQDYITSVAFSADGSKLATGSNDSNIQLWDVTTLQPLTGHQDVVRQVAFSPNSSVLASSSNDGDIRLWDVTSRRLLGELKGHSDIVTSIAFSPDGRTLASGSHDRTIRLWDVATRQKINEIVGLEDKVETIAFSADGKILASSGYEKVIRLWDVGTLQLLDKLSGPKDYVRVIAFSPDGNILAAGSEDKNIHLWNAETRAPLGDPLTAHQDAVTSLIFSPDGRLLASGSKDDSVLLWDVATRQQLSQLAKPLGTPSGFAKIIAISPDGSMLANSSEDKSVEVWEIATRRLLGRFTGHEQYVMGIAFSPDGKMLATGSNDTTIRLWNVDVSSWKDTLLRMANRDVAESK